MTRLNILTAGLLAVTLATPVMAQEVISEPGPFAQNYPDSDYMTGGYGARMTPGPRYYYRHNHYYGPGPAIGVVGVPVAPGVAITVAPFDDGYGPYAYYTGPDY
jgi:hypothetical protein